MVIRSITKLIPALIYSIVILYLFYWQFNYLYAFIIQYFNEAKLITLYAYLFVYLFGVNIVTTTIINLLHYLIRTNAFVFITMATLLIFYGLSFQEFYHIIEYFIAYPLSFYEILGVIFFILLTFGYNLYSIAILFFKTRMPFLHILIFLMIAVGYALYFTEHRTLPHP